MITAFTVVRNEPTYDPRIAAQYRDHVNLNAFLGFAAKTVKCKRIEAKLKHDKDLGALDGYFFEVAYRFEVNDQGWCGETWPSVVFPWN